MEPAPVDANACPACDTEFSTRRGLRVHHSRVHGTCLPNRTCASCDERFYSEYEKKYCSDECLDEGTCFEGAANPNYSGEQEGSECEICGGEFRFYPSEKRGLYCSDCVEEERWQTTPDVTGEKNPQWNGGKEEVTCAVCGQSIERYPSELTGDVSVCSDSCRQAWLSDAFAGDGHPNWKGGTNEPYGQGWARVRREALERDGYRCVVCGTTAAELGRNPDVHHLVPVRVFAESDDRSKQDAHVLENVVSLCVGCHRKADFGKISRGELREKTGGHGEA